MNPKISKFLIDRISTSLPVEIMLPDLHKALSAGPGNFVIQAPPGTGKTTLLPPFVANVIHASDIEHPAKPKIIVTAPRRVAVRAAARRLAVLDGSPLGTKVGFSVRGDHISGSHVQFMTPGVLIRQLLNDPELPGVGAVIIDEVHERQLDSDLLLGMLTELSQLRDDFSLIAMSATLDSDKFADLMDAEIFSAEAPIFPLDISYAPAPTPRLGARGVDWAFLDHIAQQTHAAVTRSDHSALVFVPGVGEIERVVNKLKSLGHDNVYPLHGRLTPGEQDLALTPSAQQRIIVSTPVSESSLTVPGVRIVVDSGLTRSPKRDAARGMTGLITSSCAQSSATQRAGRAGREGPGQVIRCYSEDDYSHFPRFIAPEISSADLTQTALWLAKWGTQPADLPLLDQPPHAAWEAAHEILHHIGALEGDAITPLGHRLSTLPLAPQLATSLLRFGEQAAKVLAVVSGTPQGDVEKQQPAKQEVARLRRLAPPSSVPATAGQIVGAAFPQLIGKKIDNGEYLLASGTRARLIDTDLKDAPWLAVAAINRSHNSAIIRAAARISEAHALELIGVTEETRAFFVEEKVQARRVKAAGAIELSSTPTKPNPTEAAEAIAEALSHGGLDLFHFSDKAAFLRDRLRFVHHHRNQPWPDVDAADPHLWLAQEIDALSHGARLNSIDMYPALQRLLPWPAASNFDEFAPAHLIVPSGHQHRLDYSSGRPVVKVKLQECFGLEESPRFCGIPVQFHLLSPAGRPLALTDDLRSFWAGPYNQVRAEMRGRYPKHPWPEDPWTAPATARTKNRS
ncbi:ATP-dependent RNA helicase [Corynebacterium crudilactis]|uniref:RNA helicase n=1 Tax=Corynebacterium crudilactis TaxID=1652495 RepID=A0A172QQC8_9CORY|nr:ATP-dependent RNA helicase [Corynebacterium crudilactis]ANE02893.1 ATP-dependent helicase HrpB [Corynebacterium crudilactis]